MAAPHVTAPDFSLAATGQQHIALQDLRGKHVVLYFYPKDNTPGCTTEAAEFRDLHNEFVDANTCILGVSRDSLRSHENFKAKLELPFDLLSDPEEQACLAYDVMKQKMMYGKQVRGIERSTFVINSKGHLVREWRGVKVANHAQEVLDFIRTL